MTRFENSPSKSDTIWSRRPETDSGGQKYEIFRTPLKGFSGAVITSHDVIGANTHFWQNRTIPCLGEGHCTPCCRGKHFRWYGWVMIYLLKWDRQQIFEFPGGACDVFDQYFKTHRTLIGAELRSRRVPEKENGRVRVFLSEWRGERKILPKAPSVKELMMNMWDLKDVHLEDPEIARKIRNDRFGDRVRRPDFGDEEVSSHDLSRSIQDLLNDPEHGNGNGKSA